MGELKETHKAHRNTIVTMRAKNQITIPQKIVKAMNLWEGDTFEISINKKGVIELMPVAIYPEEKIREWEKIADETAREVQAGTRPVFHSVEEMLKHLKEDNEV